MALTGKIFIIRQGCFFLNHGKREMRAIAVITSRQVEKLNCGNGLWGTEAHTDAWAGVLARVLDMDRA